MLRALVQELQNCTRYGVYLGTSIQRQVVPKEAWIRSRSCCRDSSESFVVPLKSRSPLHGLAYLRLPKERYMLYVAVATTPLQEPLQVLSRSSGYKALQ